MSAVGICIVGFFQDVPTYHTLNFVSDQSFVISC